MAKRHDEPTSFKEKLQQTIPGASSSEMKDALAKMVSPKMKHTFKEMAERFQGEQPFQGEQDPPAAAAEPSTPEPSMPEPSTSEPPSSEASPPEKSPPRASAPEASTTSSPAPHLQRLRDRDVGDKSTARSALSVSSSRPRVKYPRRWRSRLHAGALLPSSRKRAED